MAEIVSANDKNFDSFMNGVKTLIVDFWAPTCTSCMLMEPGLEKIAASYPEKVNVVKVNVNENPLTSSRFFVRSLPTLLFIKNGLVKSQLVGAVNPSQIEKILIEVQ